MSTQMLRPVIGRGASRAAKRSTNSVSSSSSTKAFFATQSGDDAKKPTALATLYLEDGTVLTGRSFGCHESVEGEVCKIKIRFQF